MPFKKKGPSQVSMITIPNVGSWAIKRAILKARELDKKGVERCNKGLTTSPFPHKPNRMKFLIRE